MALKREHSLSLSQEPFSNIFRSQRIIHETSSFIGAFSPTLSATALQALPEFRTASHRIAAWRKPSRQKSLTPESKLLYDLGHDDDGEKWAGSKLQHVLTDLGVEGVVVVARWYGGQNIGPVRFTHIETCAKEAIFSYRQADEAIKKEHAAKRLKMEEEASRKELEENLRERDLHIFVLRKLLKDKKAKFDGEEAAPVTPSKGLVDYGKMSMEGLRRVDRARDATIAFILKEIDRVEEEAKSKEAKEAKEEEFTEEDWKEVFAERDKDAEAKEDGMK